MRERSGGGSLELLVPGDMSHELIPQGGDAFRSAVTGQPALFRRNDAGEVAELDLEGLKLQRVNAS